jgi:hypothetical protein
LAQVIQQAVRRAKVAESAARADPYGCFVNPEDPGAEAMPLEAMHG